MMKRIIFTDLRRAQRKVSYFVCIGIVVALMIIVTIVAFIRPADAEALQLSSETSGKGLAFLNNIGIAYSMIPFLVGIPVFQTVFSDDFKSRTMQTAIGRGISRRRLVLCRFFEAIALLVEACLIFTVLSIVMGLVLGASIGGLATMIGKLFFDLVLVVANTSVAMLILYLTMNPTGGLVMYILMAADVFRMLLLLADAIPFLKDHGIKLSNIVPGGVHTLAANNLFGYVPTFASISAGAEDLQEGSAEALQKILEGTVEQNFLKAFGFTAILVGVFIILPLVLSQVVFRKKELEF
ncbi:MAG: hypothetical protein J6O53_07525 [Eubacterium sp.]|nr:hypothetical protein [Eubacterium sp.]